jgi:integrase
MTQQRHDNVGQRGPRSDGSPGLWWFSLRLDVIPYEYETRLKSGEVVTRTADRRQLKRGGYPDKTRARRARDDLLRLLHPDAAGTNERFRRQLGTLICERSMRRDAALPSEAEVLAWRGANHDPTKRMTMAELLDEWLDNKEAEELRPTTLGRLRNDVRVWWKPHLGAVLVDEVTDGHLRDVRRWLLRRNEVVAEARAAGRKVPEDRLDVRLRPRVLAASSIHQMFNTIRAALDYAVKKGLLLKNPCDPELVPLPKVEKKGVEAWSAEQVGRLLDHLFEVEDRLAVAYQLIFQYGPRVSEVCGLRWGSVDLDEGELRIIEQHNEHGLGRPKTQESRRTVQLDAGTVAALRQHRKTQAEERMLVGLGRAGADDYVFTRPDGSPYPRHVPTYHLQQVAGELGGLPHVTAHIGRHTAGTVLGTEVGESPKVVSEMLGHASVKFTLDNYVHPRKESQRRAAERQAAAIPRRRRSS